MLEWNDTASLTANPNKSIKPCLNDSFPNTSIPNSVALPPTTQAL